MTQDITPSTHVTILQPQGRLDLMSSPAFKQEILNQLQQGKNQLLLDLSQVTFMDSSGLGMLVGSLKAARQNGGDIQIANANEQVRMILELTTLDQIFHPYPSIEEALAHFEHAPSQ